MVGLEESAMLVSIIRGCYIKGIRLELWLTSHVLQPRYDRLFYKRNLMAIIPITLTIFKLNTNKIEPC